jgi:hydroxyacylglutathione hydrolase
MDTRCFTVGPLQENCWIVRREDSDRAFVVDPGDEADRLIAAIEGLTVEAILLTHTHFDHVGAVAALARHTGAPVYCPKLEVPVLQDINSYVFPGYGPYEPYDPEETVAGGERLSIAGIDIDVLFTPGHSPGHVSYSIPDE